MITWLKELLWDKATFRAALIGALAFGGTYYTAPKERPVPEKMIGAAILTLGVGGAAASWRPKNGA